MRTDYRKLRDAILGTLLVLAGLVAAFITVMARTAGNAALARYAAIASLVIVLLISIFLVPPLARSARAELSRLDLPFRVTLGGAVFLGLLLVVAPAAWGTGNNLLFLILSLLLSTLFVAWAAARASLRDLVVSARFPDHIFAGEPAPVIVTVRNMKRLIPSFSILIESRSRDMEDDAGDEKQRRFVKRALAYFTYIPHRAAAEQRVEHVFPRRGRALVTGFDLSTGFPFGFFRLRRRLRARNVDIIVYPRPEPVDDQLHLLPMNAGRFTSVRRGSGHDLLSLRDYQPQDDLRHIDWKSTARARRLIVREFAAEDERRVHIALGVRAPRGMDQKEFARRFERGVALAASFIAHFIDERAEVRLTLGDETGPYGAGREHLYDCLRRLALIEPQPDDPTSKKSATGWECLVPSSHPDDNYVILLSAARPGTIPSHIWRTSHVIFL
jgi:uncharacterized protein (DUF58 family)